MSEQIRQTNLENLHYGEHLVNVNSEIEHIHLNVNQTIIITTEDKVRLCLSSHVDNLQRKYDWIAPFGISLATVTSLTTADFTDFILTAELWNAIFVLISIATLLWLIWALYRIRNSTSVETIIGDLKETSTD